MKTKLVACFLFVSGTILLGIGAAILLIPEAFHARNGIELGENASLLSEVRAPGGLLFASGLVIMAGSFHHKLRTQSEVLATLVYGTFGLARLLSMALDGMPSAKMVGATAVELIVATLGLLILTRQTDPTSEVSTAVTATN